MKLSFLALAAAITLLGSLCAYADPMPISPSAHPIDPPHSGLKEIYSLAFGPLSPEDHILAETLQGVVNKGAKPRLWLSYSSFYGIVEGQLRREGVKFHQVSSVQKLLPIFKSDIKGVILYKDVDSPSLNPACALCGPMEAIAVDEAQLPMALAQGFKVLVDARNLDDAQTFAKYRALFTSGAALELGHPQDFMRDYVSKHNFYSYYAGNDEAFRLHVLNSLGPNPAVFGAGPEYPWFKDASLANGSGVASDWQINLSVLEDLPAGKLKQHVTVIPKPVPGYRYVAFDLTDGDNIQWLSDNFVDHPLFWANPLRGKIPFTWGVSPELATIAPRLLQYLYTTETSNDDIIAGPGSPGGAFVHFQPDRNSVAAQTAPMMHSSDLRILNFNNDAAGDMTETIPFLKLPNIDGAVYGSYSPFKYQEQGKIFWYRGKPCVSFVSWLQEHLVEPEQTAAKIAATPAKPLTDESSYSVITVNAWSYTNAGGPLVAVQKVISLLPANTKVVTVTQLIGMLRQNFGAKHKNDSGN